MGIIETQVQQPIDITSQCSWGTSTPVANATKMCNVMYYPQTRTVKGWFVMYGSEDISPSNILMTIGEAYRPKVIVSIPMLLVYGGSLDTMPYYGEISTNGSVYEKLGNYARRILCTFEYQI